MIFSVRVSIYSRFLLVVAERMERVLVERMERVLAERMEQMLAELENKNDFALFAFAVRLASPAALLLPFPVRLVVLSAYHRRYLTNSSVAINSFLQRYSLVLVLVLVSVFVFLIFV